MWLTGLLNFDVTRYLIIPKRRWKFRHMAILCHTCPYHSRLPILPSLLRLAINEGCVGEMRLISGPCFLRWKLLTMPPPLVYSLKFLKKHNPACFRLTEGHLRGKHFYSNRDLVFRIIAKNGLVVEQVFCNFWLLWAMYATTISTPLYSRRSRYRWSTSCTLQPSCTLPAP